MTDIAMISGTITSLKAAFDISKAMLGIRDTSLIQGKVIELQAEILTAQSSAFSAQTDQFTLLERVRDLEKQLTELEAWSAEKQRYQLTELAPGAFAYVLKPEMAAGEPKHRLCANCYQHGRKSILQIFASPRNTEIWKCYECQADVKVHVPGRDPPITVRKSTKPWI